MVLKTPTGDQVTHALRFNFKCSNNKAEYETLLVGLQFVIGMNVSKIKAFVDSRFVDNQINGMYEAK